MNQDWVDDCMQYWGKVLTGDKSHWCNDFDGLPIDETCEDEIKFCTCYND